MVKRAPEAPVQDLEPMAGLFKLLSDETRLRILILLASGERNVGSLCAELRLPQPTVSHHLGLLRMNNYIANRRNGKQVFYGLDGSVQAQEDSSLEITRDNFIVRIAASAK